MQTFAFDIPQHLKILTRRPWQLSFDQKLPKPQRIMFQKQRTNWDYAEILVSRQESPIYFPLFKLYSNWILDTKFCSNGLNQIQQLDLWLARKLE